MTRQDIRQHPKQTWKECAEMYRRLWVQASAQAEKLEKLKELLK